MIERQRPCVLHLCGFSAESGRGAVNGCDYVCDGVKGCLQSYRAQCGQCQRTQPGVATLQPVALPPTREKKGPWVFCFHGAGRYNRAHGPEDERGSMNIAEFVSKWEKSDLTERSAAQQHFLDLCELFDHPKPAQADPKGEWYTFERGAEKHSGGDGWADVWKRGFFAWEYKGKHKNLDAAYDQLLQYREALENPPLLCVCDMDRIVVHTNFTATAACVHEIPLAELETPRNLEIMRAVFHEPGKLRPGETSRAITTEAARRIGEIAQALRERGLDAGEVAHFLDRLVFCLFAEDIGLLPKDLFTRILERTRGDAARFGKLIGQLFAAMAEGGDFGLDTIRHFNGNLFTDDAVLELTAAEIEGIHAVSLLDWSAVDASVFGTLFERGLDPAKRSQLGAHYTSREDIEALIEPVIMQPLRREWDEVSAVVKNLVTTGRKKPTGREKRAPSEAVLAKARKQAGFMVQSFLQRLAQIKILDPACGSGNFLYVALQKLKDMEKAVILFANRHGVGPFLPLVGPWQLYGIELNGYAHDLAQMTVWIGYLQWIRANGFGVDRDPILRRMDNFQCKDAILDISDPDNPKEPEWPKVDFVVGNPPFLGGSKLWDELGREYQEKLWKLYDGRVPGFADLCCYWFEKARTQIEQGKCKRAGLLATQAIRGGANRQVLKRIKESGDIFFAESDRPWILDGANVHVSMVGFDNGTEDKKILDRISVEKINANLSANADTTQAVSLGDNKGVCFIGAKKAGSFDLEMNEALSCLDAANPHSRPNSDVVRPWLNGQIVTQRKPQRWIIDPGVDVVLSHFSAYEIPFRLVLERVKPQRSENKERRTRENWWLYKRCAPDMRKAVAPLTRYIATPRVSKHRLFIWVDSAVICDDGIYVFARSDDYFFGVLHSRIHEVWARAQGTQLRERESGFRYTPTTCFETFPFPDGGADVSHEEPPWKAVIGDAARELDALRSTWLNPPEWTREETLEFPGSMDGPWARYVHDPDERGIGTVRYARLVPKDESCAKKLKKRTLTNLYNERPTWLDLAHRTLDEAVFAAYGWDSGLSDEEILERLLALNLERARAEQGG